VLHGVPSFHEYLPGADIARLCCTSKGLRDTATELATQVLVNERRPCLGMAPHGNATPVEREVLPEGFPLARLPTLVEQSEAMLSEAALQISYTLDFSHVARVRAVAHAPTRPLVKHAAELSEEHFKISEESSMFGETGFSGQPFKATPRMCKVAVEDDYCTKEEEEEGVLPLDLDALWWAEVEEEVAQGMRQTPVSSGGPFTRHDVLRVLALRATAREDQQGLTYIGRSVVYQPAKSVSI
jgi:hypothetical protein